MIANSKSELCRTVGRTERRIEFSLLSFGLSLWRIGFPKSTGACRTEFSYRLIADTGDCCGTSWGRKQWS